MEAAALTAFEAFMPAHRGGSLRRTKSSVSILSTGLLLALICAGCSSGPPETAARSEIRTSLAEYTDGIGRRVSLARRPRRIVSLAPSVTELIYLVGADDRLIGVTAQCDWPEDTARKPKIGTLLSPNFEIILAARPDLIIASTAGNDRSAVLKLADLGLPVFVTAPRSVEGIFETTLAIGRITDRSSQAEQVVAMGKARLQRIRERLAGIAPVRAFFITWFEPLLAPGRKTFENDLLGLAGVTSLSAQSDEFYPRYSLEQVLAQDPDVILTASYPGRPLPDLKRIAGWNSLRAVKQGRVYVLSDVLQHPSPRFVDGVEELAARLHPERFR